MVAHLIFIHSFSHSFNQSINQATILCTQSARRVHALEFASMCFNAHPCVLVQPTETNNNNFISQIRHIQ